MDYEKKYNEALERARALIAKWQGKNKDFYIEDYSYIFPELRESEDERIRKLLVWQVYRNIEDDTNDLAGSVYDGIKGHDPDLEESIEDWKKCLAWLEKQKERGPLTKEEEYTLHRIIEYLEDETCPFEWISLLHDIYCLPYEKQKEEKGYDAIPVESTLEYKLGFKAGKDSEKQKEQMPAEWSEEDEKYLNRVINLWVNDFDEDSDTVKWLKSLRPSWKPTYEQMEALRKAVNKLADNEVADSVRLSIMYDHLKELM